MLSSAPDRGQLLAEQRSLLKAFSSFTEAAGSLERSYAQLHAEVGRLRQELRQAHTELEEERETARRLQSLAEASTTLAHEIRNPLASLELFAGLLAESDLECEQLSWVWNVQAGLRTLSATVNNVLQLHQAAAPQMMPTDLGGLLRDSVEFLQPLAVQSGIEIGLHVGSGSFLVQADRHCLQQVFLNLALNAFHAMPQGGRLRIEIVQGGEWVEVAVSDTGFGIAADCLERIFQTGFTTRPGSVGLGLAVCRKIVEQHGGSIVVRSVVGKGSTFMIKLPAQGAGE
jgi:two-component system sensor histidine kinase FlrB